MNSILAHHRNPTRLFVALGVVFAGELITIGAVGIGRSGLVSLCARLWLNLAVVFWVMRDTRTTRFHPAFEYDAFMFLAWPVLLPHYLIRTRGWAGVKLSVWLYASLLAAVVLAATVLVVGSRQLVVK